MLRARLRNQRLTGPAPAGPEAVVACLGAVQAQDYAGAKWGVAQRAGGCTDEALESALDRGAILRTHVLRPTWHFVAPADIRWLLHLTAPRVNTCNAPYYRSAGLDGAAFARSNAVLARALRGGRHLTRDELRDELRDAGLATDGLRLVLLLMRAELDAVICSGPRRGRQFTYAAFDERVAPSRAPSRDQSLADVARRYLASHGPAQPRDFAWWSGLKVADAALAFEMLAGELRALRVGAQTYWQARSSVPATRGSTGPSVRLLPSYDEYLVAFRDHAPVLGGRPASDLRTLGGRDGVFAHNTVLVNGRIAGRWWRTLGRDEVLVDAVLFAALDDGEREALDQEVVRYGRFLGSRARLRTRVVSGRRAQQSSA